MASLRDQDRQETRLEGMRRALEMTDGVVCRRQDISVQFVKGGQKHPAWCLQGRITIAVDQIPDLMSVRGMGTLIGLNYHEVAHTLYSPVNSNSLTITRTKNPHFEEAYRLLEENRVETLMIGRYAEVRKHFLLPVLTFLEMTDTQSDDELFLLTHGRRYIPKQIRSSYREYFENRYGKPVAQKCADIIGQYRFVVLATKGDFRVAGDLVNELAMVLDSEGISNLAPDEPMVGGTAVIDLMAAAGAPSADFQKNSTDQKKDADKAKQQEEKDDAAEQGAGGVSGEGGQAPSGGPEEAAGEDDGGDSQDGGGEDDGPDESAPEDGGRGGKDQPGKAGRPAPSGVRSGGSDDAPGRSDRSGDPASSSGVGTEEGVSTTLAPHEMADEIQQEINNLLKDADVLSKVRSLRNAMDDHVAQNSVLSEDDARRSKHPVTAAMVRRSDDLYQQLQEMWAQIEPGWKFGVSDGSRLDMNRVFSAQTDEEMENVYVNWEEGRQESSGLEVVLVGDESESMSGYRSQVLGAGGKKRYHIASEGVWELRYALDRVGAKSTVLTFQTGSQVLYHRDEETDPGHYHLFSSTGGTYPKDAITEARRILAVSEMPYKLMIVYTDGQWLGNDTDIQESLESMDDAVKVCAVIHGDKERPWVFSYKDQFDVVEETNGDLLDIMARAVVHMMEGMVR